MSGISNKDAYYNNNKTIFTLKSRNFINGYLSSSGSLWAQSFLFKLLAIHGQLYMVDDMRFMKQSKQRLLGIMFQ